MNTPIYILKAPSKNNAIIERKTSLFHVIKDIVIDKSLGIALKSLCNYLLDDITNKTEHS